MIDREAVLRNISGSEDRLLAARLIDKARKAEKSGRIVYSDFLDPRQRSVIEDALSDIDGIECTFYGGIEGAERVVAFLRPYFVYDDDEPEYNCFFKAIKVSAVNGDSLTHRDYLGSLMGLGIRRKKLAIF
jgi:RNA-binding protein YlmH